MKEELEKPNLGLDYLKKIALPTEKEAIEQLLIGVKDLDARMVIFNRLTQNKEVAKENIKGYFQTIIGEESLLPLHSFEFFVKNHEALELKLTEKLAKYWQHINLSEEYVEALAYILANEKSNQVSCAILHAKIYHFEKERSKK